MSHTATADKPVSTPAAPEMVTPLQPSEALRLGRLTRPLSIRGWWFSGTDAACVMGAMIEGSGSAGNALGLARRVNEAAGETCPACRDYLPGGQLLSHLNDDHLWSDAEFLAWLEGLGL